jgi:hypothetical protein
MADMEVIVVAKRGKYLLLLRYLKEDEERMLGMLNRVSKRVAEIAK